MFSAAALAVPTILLIEDYADTRTLLAELFRRNGYNIIEAEDGVEGLLKASGQQPDLIIMDLALPEMDGVATARRIHETPKLSQIPIVVVSAYVTAELEAEVKALGCVATFSKPFDGRELVEKVTEVLEAESLNVQPTAFPDCDTPLS